MPQQYRGRSCLKTEDLTNEHTAPRSNFQQVDQRAVPAEGQAAHVERQHGNSNDNVETIQETHHEDTGQGQQKSCENSKDTADAEQSVLWFSSTSECNGRFMCTHKPGICSESEP